MYLGECIKGNTNTRLMLSLHTVSLFPQNALLQMHYLLRKVCMLISIIHSFEVTMHYGVCNAHCTTIYAIMDVVHSLYVEECPLGSCIQRFEGTTQGWEPKNIRLHDPKGHSPVYNDEGTCTERKCWYLSTIGESENVDIYLQFGGFIKHLGVGNHKFANSNRGL